MNNTEQSPFLRSKCVGGLSCSATCEVHKRTRRRSPKKLQMSEFSDDDMIADGEVSNISQDDDDDGLNDPTSDDEEDDEDDREADDENQQDSIAAINRSLLTKKHLRRNTQPNKRPIDNGTTFSFNITLLIGLSIFTLNSIVIYFVYHKLQENLHIELAKVNKPSHDPQQERLQTLEDLLESTRNHIRLLEDKILDTSTLYTATPSEPSLTIEAVSQLLTEALNKYDADKTDLADYALESSGATIVSTRCTKNYPDKNIKYSLNGLLPIFLTSNSPRVVIQPTIVPGECWAFAGSQGQMVVQLSRTIVPTSFTYEHIRKQLSPDLSIVSAPKNFRIKSLKDASDQEGIVLGEYQFNDNGEPLQQFDVQNPNPIPTRFIELIILSNHGELQYTCLYRFRVHGRKYDQ